MKIVCIESGQGRSTSPLYHLTGERDRQTKRRTLEPQLRSLQRLQTMYDMPAVYLFSHSHELLKKIPTISFFSSLKTLKALNKI